MLSMCYVCVCVEKMAEMPELQAPEMPAYDIIEYDPLLDSTDMCSDDWVKITCDIEEHCKASLS